MNTSPDRDSPRVERPVRHPQLLAEHLFQLLNEYSLAAGAASVALLALSAPAEAAPVCGSLSVTLAFTETYAFNPAHQKVAPFNVAVTYNEASSHPQSRRARAFFTPNIPDAKVLTSSRGLPLELSSGATIGSKGTFGKGKEYGLLIGYYYFNRYIANFQPNQSGYVGFHFAESGQPHYGWLRLRFVSSGFNGPALELSEYGYESSASTAITAGNCGAAAAAATREDGRVDNVAKSTETSALKENRQAIPASLGMLALGSQGVKLWRKESQ